MTDQTVPQPVARRADKIVVGDRIPDEYLAFRFNQGPAQVVFVAREVAQSLAWIFVAYRYPNGQHDSMTIRPEAVLQVYPAATDVKVPAGPELCSWCPDPYNPDPTRHPGGTFEHVPLSVL